MTSPPRDGHRLRPGPILDLVDEPDPSNTVLDFSFQKQGYVAIMQQSMGANDADPNVSELDFPTTYLVRSIQKRYPPPVLQPRKTHSTRSSPRHGPSPADKIALLRFTVDVYAIGLSP
ncbi:hypothetical protein H310_10887 [Aphanomyces invadans]|uniref:Uncharacterized protein n=1 Tax=Aphanomyces invadans TaxID=157072 RepID=A0A024TP99_9STRA|nr:hypothetical protein H310_10887 [Aphanomyces invadans]ETV95843.1 hypothetical protein H310_10887 [Aphanomyces invadans]|eukprot:XP_008875594.1 hypothetical protein H310_10887 [Aphanomyces invadans]